MKYTKKIYIILLLISVFIISGIDYVTAAKATEVIKVGYFESGDFIKENDGVFSGYCVDYLEELAKHTGWKYEYVYCTWEDCLDKVENGEIDFMCTVQYTEDRAERFIFSKEEIGTEHCLIYARTDADIYFGDYESMDRARTAMLPDTVFDEELLDLTEQKGVTLTPVYYESIEEVKTALASGEVELAVIGSMFGYNDAKIVARNDGQPYYCITGKKNAALMEQFDEAVRTMKVVSPGFESRLYQKYYGSNKISSVPLFTREQHDYIAEQKEIVVKLGADSRPLCYEEDGVITGVFPEVLRLIADKSGLNIVIEEISKNELDNVTDSICEEGFVTLRAKRVLEYRGLDESLISSDPIVETKLSYVRRREDIAEAERDDYVFAITKEMAYYLPGLLAQESDNYEVKYYDSLDECMQAVVDKEADIAIQDSYLVSYMLQSSEYSEKLVEVYGAEILNGMCVIASGEDKLLIEIINQTVDYISEEDLREIIDVAVKGSPYKMTLKDVVYEHGVLLILICVGIVAGIVLYTWLNKRMTDLKVQKKEYELLQKKAQQDQLTGVYNKAFFYERAAGMLEATGEEMCIVMVDVVNFKVINDLYGIEQGDKLLKYMAEQLKNAIEKHDGIVARFNADHFYVCIKKDAVNEETFIRKFRKTPVDNIDVNVLYGVYTVRDKRIPINIMCDRANMAAHDAGEKKVGGHIIYYSEEERNKLIKKKEIEEDMEKALEDNQFHVFIQPKYDVVDNHIVGGEALARWIHPDKGMISPGEFIPIFETNGFIRFLDYCIWEETCKFIVDCKKNNLKSYPISINVSRIHFYSKELKRKLTELLEKYELDASELEIEITESVYVEDAELINKRITELQQLGFKIAMDDFGSGYSSLNMLKEIPLDILKMDLKFLDSSDNVSKSHKILGALIQLAKSLELKVVVEGVETEEQVEFLKSMGKMGAQGYYYSRPLPAEDYKKLLEAV